MKVSLYEAGGRLEGGFTIPGMILTGPLLLSGAVSSPLEAIHKQYVDTAVTNLDAGNFVSGTIATARMPGFVGDIVSANSTNNVALKPSGVIAGDYTKVTVDAKGRVIAGLSLTEADLPSFNWAKITGNKPSTLAGYGITDGVSTVNGAITGNLTLLSNPSADDEAVTKAYADSNGAGGAKIQTGDIMSDVSNVTPTGFLRCNGGELSKTTYSALYAVIGDDFTGGNTQPGNGKPWRYQYSFNSDSSGEISGWTTSPVSTPLSVRNSMILMTKNRVYILGGHQGSTAGPVTNVYTATIDSSGVIGAWSSSTSLPIALASSELILTKNRVYLIGGYTSSSAFTANVYTALINADGTLGTWVQSSALPTPVTDARAVVTKNRVYLFATRVDALYGVGVFSAPINADGTLGVWARETNLPSGMHFCASVVTSNRVYLIGGRKTGAISSVHPEVYYTSISPDGVIGTWTRGVDIPEALAEAQAITTKNFVYLIGGSNASGSGTTGVYVAPINLDGTLGTWRKSTNLMSNATANATPVVTNSRVYLFAFQSTTSSYTGGAYMGMLAGGLNDYSAYYDGTLSPISLTNFKLPDYTSYEKVNQYYYIKS